MVIEERTKDIRRTGRPPLAPLLAEIGQEPATLAICAAAVAVGEHPPRGLPHREQRSGVDLLGDDQRRPVVLRQPTTRHAHHGVRRGIVNDDELGRDRLSANAVQASSDESLVTMAHHEHAHLGLALHHCSLCADALASCLSSRPRPRAVEGGRGRIGA